MSLVVIGICIRDDKLIGLTTERIRKYIEYFPYEYVDFICFHWDKIDVVNYSVAGKKFNRKSLEWDDGIYPLPHVAFIQGFLNKNIINKLKDIFGVNLFNNFLFDKWEGWEFLSDHKIIKQHLPITHKIQLERLALQLNLFKDFLIKPSIGSSSGGIIRVKSRNDGTFDVFHSIKNECVLIKFDTIKELMNWIESKVKNGQYILQQGIETIRYKDNATDIRLNMNKNSNGVWEKSIVFFRISSNNNIVIPKKVSRIYTFDQLRSSSSFLPEVDIRKLESQIDSIGNKICQAFDQAGYHMGDLGIDLGLDMKGKLWIFEINHIPYPALGAIHDPSVYKPLEYALFLAKNKSKY
ncbi:YheC/YheD family protein [Metabacillus niabensis]|uniref:YheC/YheD family protein n=1 Tax=Metabacillus niabensis TaxID=324854 RepID=UPI001CFA46B5|nr:YheC/YheD family protein [Metabacillus niabensis]